jgi:hypothetical protein
MLKDLTRQLIDKTIDLLQSIRPEDKESNWSLYVINTTKYFTIIAAKDGYADMIPEDGSFISGFVIETGLTEDSAKSRLEEMGNPFYDSEWEETYD